MMRRIALVIATAGLLGGCAEMTHLTRVRKADTAQFVLIDAKQRAISADGGIVCAEPSPDALSALAASNSLNFTTPEGTSLGQSLAIAETAGAIGLRTQSIQLLRDHMYRVCEAYQAGKISSTAVELLHRRFQTTVVGILAIEQLTSVARPPSIVLGGSASAGDAEAVLKLSASRDAQAAKVETAVTALAEKDQAAKVAEEEVVKKQAAYDEADPANRQAEETALDEAKKLRDKAIEERLRADSTLSRQKAYLASIDRALTLAQATGSASATGVIETISTSPPDLAEVAERVESIVKMTYELTNSSDFCMVLLSRAAEQGTTLNEKSEVVKKCLETIVGPMLN